MALRGWSVTPATKSCCWPSAASAAGFVRPVPVGAWLNRGPPGRARDPLGLHRQWVSRRWNSWRSWQHLVPLRRVHLRSALWGLPSAAQPPAWGEHPDPTSARHRRAGGAHRVASLELGAAAPADVCTGHGALPLVSAGGAAHHRGHHAGRGDPQDPPASAPCGRPTPNCAGSFPPRSLRLVLRLTSSGGERTRLRPLPWGGTKQPSSDPPPEVSLHTAGG